MRENLHSAFSFLTVLIKGKVYSDKTMQQCVYCFPFVGAVIFLLSALLALLFWYLFSNTWLCAAAFLFCDCILIRGLHHDGLADIADALGSGKTGDEFRVILKDSRIGSFGVMALIFYFLLAVISLEQIIAMNLPEGKFLCFAVQMVLLGFWSRLGLLAMPLCSHLYIPKEQKFSLAKLMFAHFDKKYFLFWYVLIFFASSVLFNASFIIICTTLSCLFIWPLYTTAQKENGYNGDFLGASCLLWELAGFLSLLLFFRA